LKVLKNKQKVEQSWGGSVPQDHRKGEGCPTEKGKGGGEKKSRFQQKVERKGKKNRKAPRGGLEKLTREK